MNCGAGYRYSQTGSSGLWHGPGLEAVLVGFGAGRGGITVDASHPDLSHYRLEQPWAGVTWHRRRRLRGRPAHSYSSACSLGSLCLPAGSSMWWWPSTSPEPRTCRPGCALSVDPDPRVAHTGQRGGGLSSPVHGWSTEAFGRILI